MYSSSWQFLQMVSKKICSADSYRYGLEKKHPRFQAALDSLRLLRTISLLQRLVEQVRGVDCSGVSAVWQQKRDLGWRKEQTWGTGQTVALRHNRKLLRCFNISSLDELPPLPEGDEQRSPRKRWRTGKDWKRQRADWFSTDPACWQAVKFRGNSFALAIYPTRNLLLPLVIFYSD